MKNNFIIISLIAILSLFSSCTEYLNIPAEAAKTDEEVFGDYYNFQGYIDKMYKYVPTLIQLTSDASWGGEAICATVWSTGYNAPRGLYSSFVSRGYLNYDEKNHTPESGDIGIWYSWDAIRTANLGLKNLDLFKGTEEEKKLIEGQLYFFRGFFHQEILSAWGPIPFIDKVLVDDFQLPRFYKNGEKAGYQAVVEYIAADLNKAATLLPVNWAEPTRDLGRPTALTAKGYEARAYLYAGSPLMEEYSGTSISDLKEAKVNTEYMEKAAIAAGECLKMMMDNSATYGLLPWDEYSDMFFDIQGYSCWTKETLWGRILSTKGSGCITNRLGRIHLPNSAVFGGNIVNNTPTQNYVDLFEMKDGSLYDSKSMDADVRDTDGDGKNDWYRMWDDRDSRFRSNIYVDRDLAGFHNDTKLDLYVGGLDMKDNSLCPYFIHKFWPKGANKKDNGDIYKNMIYITPLMRLAEVYLIYAEAINEAYGDPNKTAGGCSMTGLQAVNAVRTRANQPETNSTGGAHGSFRNMVLNERAVELCFEGFWWYDLRRYKIGETMHNEEIQTLEFDAEWTNFKRSTVLNRTFEEKHYWLPFPKQLPKTYEGFPQNPGWQ